MSTLCIVHVSDLHYSQNERHNLGYIRKAILEDLEMVCPQHSLKPNVLVFSGDLVYEGDNGFTEERKDFVEAYDFFLKEILMTLGIDCSRLFLCPGNHDIQRSKVNDFAEIGFESKVVDRESADRIIIKRDPLWFGRLEAYERFISTLPGQVAEHEGHLYSVRTVDVDNTRIGVATFNSAWRSRGEGDSRDFGNLLIGERSVAEAVDSLSDCDLMIGVMHHPFDYLKYFEAEGIRRLVYSEFDLWLCGHTHQPAASIVSYLDADGILISSAGSLYQTREHFNGYTILNISLVEPQASVYFREYNDRSHKFGPGIAYSPDDSGVVHYSMDYKKTKSTVSNFSLIMEMRSALLRATDPSLLTSAINQNQVVRQLPDVFVCPPLHHGPSGREEPRSRHDENQSDEKLELNTLLDSSENLMFLGGKESGKTTLMEYICLSYLENYDNQTGRIPVLVNYSAVPPGKKRFKQAIASLLVQYDYPNDLESWLDNGKLILMVDDCNLNDLRIRSALIEFVQSYPQVRTILASSEVDSGRLLAKRLRQKDVEFSPIYIGQYGSKQVAMLVEKWFGDSLVVGQNETLRREILRSISGVDFPRTPFVVSMLLRIIEEQIDFIQANPGYFPLNKAVLVEKYIEVVLEKRATATVHSKTLVDYRIKQFFLSELAYMMHHMGDELVTIDRYADFEREYLRDIGVTSYRGLMSYFVERGIFLERSGCIAFRFRAYQEFFLAQHIADNREYYQSIQAEKSYLDVYEELDYLTGLQRNNQDLLDSLINDFRVLFADEITAFDLDTFQYLLSSVRLGGDYYRPESGATESDANSAIQEDSTIKQDLADILGMEDEEELRRQINLAADSLDMRTTPEISDLRRYLSLIAKIINNCELIRDTNYKEKCISFCVEQFLSESCRMVDDVDQWIADLAEAGPAAFARVFEFQWGDVESLISNPEKFKDFVHGIRESQRFIILYIQTDVLRELLGNSKLGTELRRICETPSYHLAVRVVCCLIYAELGLPNYLSTIRNMLQQTSDSAMKPYLEMLEIRVEQIYSKLPQNIELSQIKSMESLLWDIHLKIHPYRGGRRSLGERWTTSPAVNVHKNRVRYLKEIQNRRMRMASISNI